MRKRMALGLAGRIIVSILLLLFIVQIFDWMLSDDPPVDQSPEMRIARQVIAATGVIDKTPPAERPALAEALTGVALIASVAPEPVQPKERFDAEVGEDEEDVKALALLNREFGREGYIFGMAEEPLGRWHGVISIALEDGNWAIFRVPVEAFFVDEYEDGWFTRTLFWLLILVLVFWAGKRLARPVRRFADAAERLGKDLNAPPLPETGSRELRRASRAFNGMQKRIQRMVDDRNLMLAAIAHDLRTVLTRLRLRTEFIEEEEQREKAARDIEEMQSMIDVSISFARGEAETETREPCDIALMLKELVSDLGAPAEGSSEETPRLTYEGPDRLSYPCGPTELRRTFRNLLVNALGYGKRAHVTLRKDESGIEIRIEDEGPGIPDAQLEHVFRPFYRVESSRNRETGGTGLGLAIARTVILRHGGEIALANRPEGGLAVTITLPPAG